MIVTEKVDAKKKIRLDINSCLEAEYILKEYSDKVYRDRPEIINKILLFKTVEELFRESIIAEIQTKKFSPFCLDQVKSQANLNHHMYLGLLTRRTLSRTEFDELFDNHPNLDDSRKEELWEHNTHCAVFFVNIYQEIIETIDFLKNKADESINISKIIRWIFKMLEIIKQVKHNIHFCQECGNYNDEGCNFWREVVLGIEEITEKFDPDTTSVKILKFFKALSIPCEIPSNIEELKKMVL